MILAAPLVIPFAQAVGLSVGTLGMAALADQVNNYIQANPEESMKILSTIIPGVGIGQIFMSKEDKISLEDLDEMTDEEAQDLSKEEKAELMKQAGKSGGKNKRQTMIDISEKLGLSGPGKEKQDIEYEVDERYDEGGVEDAPKPKFDYTKFFRRRRADGGAIGVESLFEEKVPAAPSQLVSESDILLGYRGDDAARSDRASGRKSGRADPRGGVDRSAVSEGSQYARNVAAQNNEPSFKEKVKSVVTNPYVQTLGGAVLTGGINTAFPGVLDKINKARLVSNALKYGKDIAIEDELENITTQGGIVPYADGGRVGFNLGGLTGPALSIYNNMKAAGYFTDDEIRNAIIAAGYEIPGETQAVEETGIIASAPNIINQDRGGDGPSTPPAKDPYGGLGYSSANFGLGQGINKDAVMDYEADAYQQGRTLTGQLNKIGLGFFEALKNIPTPFNIVRKGIEFAKQKELEKQRQAEAAARDAARELQEQNIANRTGGYQFGYSPSSDFMSGGSQGKGGYDNTEAGIGAASAAMGSFARGGLATMFKEKK